MIAAIVFGILEVNSDTFAAALSFFNKKYGFQCNPGIARGVEQTNIEFQLFLYCFLFSHSNLCSIAAIIFGTP